MSALALYSTTSGDPVPKAPPWPERIPPHDLLPEIQWFYPQSRQNP
jgi:hypothetical protein